MGRSLKKPSKTKVKPFLTKDKNLHAHNKSRALELSLHIKLMCLAGHFLPDFNPMLNSRMKCNYLRAIYSIIHMSLMSLQFAAMAVELVKKFDDVDALTTNAITLLFFLHGPTKVFYFAFQRKKFYKTMSLWDTALTEWNSDNEVSQEMQNISTAGNGSTKSGEEMKRNSITIQVDRQRVPLFIASNNFFVKDAQRKMRRLLVSIMSGSAVAAMFWSIRPFLGLGHHGKTSTTFLLGDNTSITNEGNPLAKSSAHFTNETSSRGQWNLIVDATYPWDTSTNPAYALTLTYQFYWIVFCMAQINLLDLLFCSWLIFACEQIGHLKSGHGVMDEIFYQHSTLIRNGFPSIPKTFSVLRSSVMAQDESTGLTTEGTFGHQRNIVSPYLGKRDNIIDNPHAALEAIGRGMFRANDTKAVIQKATKYWVEKHKHIVRFVECIGDSYGMALLIHMLTSTIALTLLSYEATKISSVDMHALTVITYLLYTLGQVFLFCIYGNNLIEESTSVMQAAYDSPWYECTEEAKAFIQIVCQQSQRPMSVSGAKFFTVSLDLFASVLGAVVTYFMVLIQLK